MPIGIADKCSGPEAFEPNAFRAISRVSRPLFCTRPFPRGRELSSVYAGIISIFAFTGIGRISRTPASKLNMVTSICLFLLHYFSTSASDNEAEFICVKCHMWPPDDLALRSQLTTWAQIRAALDRPVAVRHSTQAYHCAFACSCSSSFSYALSPGRALLCFVLWLSCLFLPECARLSRRCFAVPASCVICHVPRMRGTIAASSERLLLVLPPPPLPESVEGCFIR